MTYFDARGLPVPSDEYVAWIDVMGVQSHMHRSISVAANFVFKLHVAALDSPGYEVSLYPVMDGFYVTSKTRAALEAFLRSVFSQCAHAFAKEKTVHFRFVIRGGIAHGEVYHGSQIENGASKRLAENPGYRGAIVLGPPVVDAHQIEPTAPPFGLAVHQSAKIANSAGEEAFADDWWHWYDDDFDKSEFSDRLREYYDWCRKDSGKIKYDIQRILFHEYLALKYFS